MTSTPPPVSITQKSLDIRLERHQEPLCNSDNQDKAQDTVVALPELLERIFSYCEIRHLLVSLNLVCTQWHHVIAESPFLQKDLFFAPDWEKPPEDYKKNPLLDQAFGSPFFKDCTDPHDRAPLEPEAIGPAEIMKLNLPIADMRDGHRRHLAFARKGASWRRMLVVQPPIVTLRFDPFMADGERGDIKIPAGLRMSHLYDLVYYRVFSTTPTSALRGDLVQIYWVDESCHAHVSEKPAGWKNGLKTEHVTVTFSMTGSSYGADQQWAKNMKSRAWMFECEEYDCKRLEDALEKKLFSKETLGE